MQREIIRVEPLSTYAEARKVPISMAVKAFKCALGKRALRPRIISRYQSRERSG